ncbi:MAG: ribbon-helix-helix domain-containing protein [Oscillospiraceae bacterium]|nr:ribbon-helix-helix domain-containing protein [Oscillospiraceae bacterium]
MGRPTDNPKGISTHVRLDAECNTILDAYCKQTQVPRTEAIRRGIKKLKDDLKK